MGICVKLEESELGEVCIYGIFDSVMENFSTSYKCKYTNNPWLGVWWTLVVVLYKAVSEFPAVNSLTSRFALHSWRDSILLVDLLD